MDLTTAEPRRLFFKYLFTALGSTIITSIYSSVDLICVGHYCGANGSAAISCLNPMWSLMISIGMLFGIGGAVWMSNRRGDGDAREGDEYFTLSLSVAVVLSLALTAIYYFGRVPLLTLFGANETILPYASDYIQWIALAVPMFLVGTLLSTFIRNDGSPGLCTAAILTGGAINIVGDIYFVFDFGLGLGMSGAGLATALGQTVAFLMLCSYFFRKRCRLRLATVKQALTRLRNIIGAGFAPFIVDLSFGVTVLLFNRQIMRYSGSVELAVFGTVSTVVIFFQSLFYGVGQAIQPIVSYNNGAGLIGRVKVIRRLAVKTALIMSVLFFALAELLPTQILRLYMTVNDDVLSIGPTVMRLYSISFLFMGINVVSAYYLQSLLRARQSIVISISRGFLLCAIFVFALPAVFGFSSIWLTMPLSEAITMLYAVFCLRSASKGLSA